MHHREEDRVHEKGKRSGWMLSASPHHEAGLAPHWEISPEPTVPSVGKESPTGHSSIVGCFLGAPTPVSMGIVGELAGLDPWESACDGEVERSWQHLALRCRRTQFLPAGPNVCPKQCFAHLRNQVGGAVWPGNCRPAPSGQSLARAPTGSCAAQAVNCSENVYPLKGQSVFWSPTRLSCGSALRLATVGHRSAKSGSSSGRA